MIKHADGVYEIKNFLTNEELNGLLFSVSEDGFNELHPQTIIKDLQPESLKYMPEIYDRLLSYFNNAHSLTEIANIRRFKENEYMSPHTDNGLPDDPRKIIFGIVIYLNDDFVGGQISYPDLGLIIQPEKGSLLIHHAMITHEVLPIVRGKRYCITSFVFGDNETEVKI